jgi:pyridoxine 4-dehydrogenase
MPSLTAPLGPHTVRRIGFGAMQLPGKGVLGPPDDHDQAVAVVRRARERGVDHIDTASFYGPDVANQLLHEALDPWPVDLRIVSKVGARRDQGKWLPALAPDEIRRAVARDLETLGIDRLTAVNLRVLDTSDDVFLHALETLVGLRHEGVIELIGLSNIETRHLDLAVAHADIACVQNQYGLLDRDGEDLLDITRKREIAFVPYFPLGSAFGAAPRPAEHPEVQRIADELQATPAQIALAWLLHHAENVLLIPGTSSLAHLEENLDAGDVALGEEHMAVLDGLAH